MEQTDTPVVETATRYELMVIFLPDLGEEAVKKELTEIKKLLSNDGGDVFNEDIWGLKDFTYRIKKQDEGYYVVLNFSLPGDKVAEVEHLLNIHQTVLRYLITKTPFDYKIRTLKDYEAEAEKLDKEEQAKKEAGSKKVVRKKVEKRVEIVKEAPQQEKAEVKKEEAAPAPEKAEAKEETAPAPKKPSKKAEKDDLDDFDKKLKSIIDDPDISL